MPKRKHPSGQKRSKNHKPKTSIKTASAREDNAEYFWIYGVHAALAALSNPSRPCKRVVASATLGKTLGERLKKAHQTVPGRPKIEKIDREGINLLLPKNSIHQGIALFAGPLAEVSLEKIVRNEGTIVILDQASDPRNIGAVLRSAAAFGASGVIVQDRHAPPVTGTLCKAASGAADWVPLVRAVNLARALNALKEAGYWCVGLDGKAKETLAEADLSGKVALVLGSEGEGLRRLTRDSCDLFVRVPIRDQVESLNLSTAAAIALYELKRGGRLS